MRRAVKNRGSKRAFTLVELIVAMALMSIFAVACVMLFYPVFKIYTHTNELSRAQLLADTVVDSIRAECARTYITGKGDVWIASSGNTTFSSADALLSGKVLVIRRSSDYCETIASNYSITGTGTNSLYNRVYEAEQRSLEDGHNPQTDSAGITSRAIYRMFPTPVPAPGTSSRSNLDANYIHFGYYKLQTDTNGYIYPSEYYDFTNPFSYATYGDYTVDLTFRWDGGELPAEAPTYILCDVSILHQGSVFYTRTVALCFASPTSA